MVRVMGDIKNRIHKLYDKFSRKAKTAAVVTLLGGTTQAQAALPEQADTIKNEIRTEVLDNVKDTVSVEPVTIKDLELGRFVFSAEVLDSVEAGAMGKKLASQARRAQRKINDEIHCFRAFKLAVRSAGLGSLTGVNAWEAADQLRENENFVEIMCSKEDLDKLPDGAVVVYGKGETVGTRHGHVGTIDKKKDVSSKVRPINTRGTRSGEPYGEISVFLPADTIVKDKSLIMSLQNTEQKDTSKELLLTDIMQKYQNQQNGH